MSLPSGSTTPTRCVGPGSRSSRRRNSGRSRPPAARRSISASALEQADLNTPVAALGLSTRARNALERADILTVRNLLEFPIGDIHLMRGVGNQTRQEIIDFISQLRGRFPNVEAVGHEGEAVPRRAFGSAQPRTPAASDRRGRRFPRKMPSGASAPPCSGSRLRSHNRPATGRARPRSPTPWTSPVPVSARS